MICSIYQIIFTTLGSVLLTVLYDLSTIGYSNAAPTEFMAYSLRIL